MKSEKSVSPSAYHASAPERDERVIPCPACGLVDIDTEQEDICFDCEDEMRRQALEDYDEYLSDGGRPEER